VSTGVDRLTAFHSAEWLTPPLLLQAPLCPPAAEATGAPPAGVPPVVAILSSPTGCVLTSGQVLRGLRTALACRAAARHSSRIWRA
jgi:hypothetical protein